MVWIVIGYLICSFICYTMTFAHFQGVSGKYAEQFYRDDFSVSVLLGLLMGMLGPVGIILAFLLSSCAKHVFKVK